MAHTAFMRFPIDVVFLDTANAIVEVVHDLRPWRMPAAAARAPRSSWRPARLAPLASALA